MGGEVDEELAETASWASESPRGAEPHAEDAVEAPAYRVVSWLS